MKTKTSQSETVRSTGVNKSTISRELACNKGKRGYRTTQAHRVAVSLKTINSHMITDFGWAYIEELLSRKYSPEQITGRLRYLDWEGVPSHERVYADKKDGRSLYKYLRCQKVYRKRGYTNQDRCGHIANSVGIEIRPIVADNRERLGDFEGDTVIGKGHKGVLGALVDRATRETKIKALQQD